MLTSAIFWGCLLPAAVAGIVDWRTYRLPNWITLPVLAAGLVYHGCIGSWWLAVLGLVVSLPLALAGALGGQIGWGDAKFMAALGAWWGPVGFLLVLYVACALGVAAGMVRLARAGLLREYWRGVWRGLRRLATERRLPRLRRLPPEEAPAPANVIAFGPCLAAAVWLLWIVLTGGGM